MAVPGPCIAAAKDPYVDPDTHEQHEQSAITLFFLMNSDLFDPKNREMVELLHYTLGR